MPGDDWVTVVPATVGSAWPDSLCVLALLRLAGMCHASSPVCLDIGTLPPLRLALRPTGVLGEVHQPMSPKMLLLLLQAVVQYAAAHRIGLAVLPHQEQQGVAAALYRLAGVGGSLTDRLLRQLNCPVVVLRD